jgi:threonine synthase
MSYLPLVIQNFFDVFLHQYKTSEGQHCSQVSVSIPSGAAGHLTAAVIAKLMGVPIVNIIVATNANDILVRLLNSGVLSRSRSVEVTKTHASAMDIAVPYNLERLFHLAAKGNIEYTSVAMAALRAGRDWDIGTDVKTWFEHVGIVAHSVSDADIITAIRFSHEFGSVQDPHTAVGISAARFMLSSGTCHLPVYCMGCASAVKFVNVVRLALGSEADKAMRRIESINKHAAALRSYNTLLPSLLLSARPKFVETEDWVARLQHEIEVFVDES